MLEGPRAANLGFHFVPARMVATKFVGSLNFVEGAATAARQLTRRMKLEVERHATRSGGELLRC
jgi:hypothetical protein